MSRLPTAASDRPPNRRVSNLIARFETNAPPSHSDSRFNDPSTSSLKAYSPKEPVDPAELQAAQTDRPRRSNPRPIVSKRQLQDLVTLSNEVPKPQRPAPSPPRFATDIIELKSLESGNVQRLPKLSALHHVETIEMQSDLPRPSFRISPQEKAASKSPPVMDENQTLVAFPNARAIKETAADLLRPILPKSISAGALSTATQDIPAHAVFSRTAMPLNLPELDQYLDSIPDFCFSDSDKLLGKNEVDAWSAFVRDRKPSILSRLSSVFKDLTHQAPHFQKLDDSEIQARLAPAKHSKRKIFPPMHLLPDNLTLADLKINHHSPMPALTLSTIIGSLIDAIIGGETSSYAAHLMNLEVLRDTIQTLGLATSFAATPQGKFVAVNQTITTMLPQWRVVAFNKVPAVLGLDFVSAFGMALFFFWIFIALCSWALFEFFIFTGGWKGWQEKNDVGEAFDSESPPHKQFTFLPKVLETRIQRLRSSRNYRMSITFLLTSLYVPLSKISIDALCWAEDFWPVENPYLTTDHPIFPPNVNATLWRDPADFCWTTTMYQPDGFNHLNWAWLIIPVAFLTVALLTVWFPIRLYNTIKAMVPKVDPFTELGEKRNDSEAEYERLLNLDQRPLAFMYNSYRRKWAGFKAIYMAFKLVNVLCICLITKDTCFFRSIQRARINVVQESCQLSLMVAFFVSDTISSPFINSMQNNSDWVSRITYVLISLYGLLVTLNAPGKQYLEGSILLTTTVSCYTLNVYFSVFNTQIAQRLVKKVQRRIDFSIDFGSPVLDCSKHIARRIWQESIGVILLADKAFAMPKQEKLDFAHLPNAAPYLLKYTGSVAERHVENIKILREIGLDAYTNGALPTSNTVKQEQDRIVRDFLGPDMFYRSPNEKANCQLSSYWGRAVVVPFPFCLVIHYDSGGHTHTISDADSWHDYIVQNTSRFVADGRHVRQMLRALEGQHIMAPFALKNWSAEQGRRLPWRRKRVTYTALSQYTYGILRIQRNSVMTWQGHNLSSGFRVSVEYGSVEDKKRGKDAVVASAHELGLSDDFKLNNALAKLLQSNSQLIKTRLPHVQQMLLSYRQFLSHEFLHKTHALSYQFLLHVLGDSGLSLDNLSTWLARTESNRHIQSLAVVYKASMQATVERMRCVSRSKTTQRWFLIWDDMYRRNRSTISQLERFPQSFSPFYRTSICYRPLSRDGLLIWLEKHGIPVYKHDFFHVGFINSIYFVLDEITFNKSSQAIPLVVQSQVVPFENNLLASSKWIAGQPNDSVLSTQTFDTGNGTSHDDMDIRARHAFPFEEAYDAASLSWSFETFLPKLGQLSTRLSESTQRWFGLSTIEHCHDAKGIALRLHINRNHELESSHKSV